MIGRLTRIVLPLILIMAMLLVSRCLVIAFAEGAVASGAAPAGGGGAPAAAAAAPAGGGAQTGGTAAAPAANGTTTPTTPAATDTTDASAVTATTVETSDLASELRPFPIYGHHFFKRTDISFEPNTDSPVPSTYVLGAGDRLTVVCWFGLTEYERANVIIAPNGEIFLKRLGSVAVAQKTLAQVQKELRQLYAKSLTKFDLEVQVSGRRNINIWVMGEVTKPGQYLLSSMATVFTALYAAGGPTQQGSLRKIRVMRDGKQVGATIDIYQYLMKGENIAVPLNPGDTIFVPLADTLVSIAGEVRRPATYELLAPDTSLSAALTLAGGTTARSLDIVAVVQIRDHNRQITDLKLPNDGKFTLAHGNLVHVKAVPPPVRNAVKLEGELYHPGYYSLEKGTTLSTLLDLPKELTVDSYLEQAIITRNNDDGTRQKISLNIRAIMAKDANADQTLKAGDVVHIYNRNEMPALRDNVMITGQVVKPGTFPWHAGLRVSDTFQLAFGFTPDAFLVQATLSRINEDGTRRQFPIDLHAILAKDAKADLPLHAGDIIHISSRTEMPLLRDSVVVSGEVVKPGTFPWHAGMRISDAVQLAFGTTLNSYLVQATLSRINADGSRRELPIDLRGVIVKDAKADLPLQAADILRIYNRNEMLLLRDSIVVSGEVVKPGTFPWHADMRISDAVQLAFGTTLNSYLAQATLSRSNVDGTRQQIAINLQGVLAKDANADLPLQAADVLLIYKRNELPELLDNVMVKGEVVKPGVFPWHDGMRVSDVVGLAFGFSIDAYLNRAVIYRYPVAAKPELLTFDLGKAMEGDVQENLLLRPRDQLVVKSRLEVQDFSISVEGEVKTPGLQPFFAGMRVADAIFLAGGLKINTMTNRALLIRKDLTSLREDLVEIRLDRALDKDQAANLELAAGDRLVIYPASQLGEGQFVTSDGALTAPGRFPFIREMRVSHLVFLSKGLTVAAYAKRAELFRTREDNTTEIIQVNLYEGQRDLQSPTNILLQPRDRLLVHTRDEVGDTPKVKIDGYVRKPAQYSLSEGMRLSDLIFLAGDLLPEADLTLEIVHNKEGKPQIEQCVLARDGKRTLIPNDILLTDNDLINVHRNRDYQDMAEVIYVQGELTKPGSYSRFSSLTGKPRTLYEVLSYIDLTKEAYTPGIVLFRTMGVLGRMPEQQAELKRVLHELDMLAGVDGGAGKENLADPTKVAQQQTIRNLSSSLAQVMMNEKGNMLAIVIPPRAMQNQQFSISMPIDVAKLLASRGKHSDFVLEPGDIIMIPKRPETVVLAGGVVNNGAVMYQPNRSLGQYLNDAGGISPDGDSKRVVVVHMNGQVVLGKRGDPIDPGDIIVVPTKPIIKKMRLQSSLETALGLLSQTAITIAPYVKY